MNTQAMDLNLNGKNALVGGSSKGIGKAAAYELAALGANVTLVSRSANVMADIVQDLDDSKGQQHDFLQADFANSTELKQKLSMLTQVKPYNILINNTGGPPAGPIIEAEPDAFARAFHNHLLCNQILVQALVPGMKKAGYGRIINVLSTSVKTPLNNLGVSNTTRAAVANWAKTLANELGQFGITVNNLLPGYTQTERLDSLINTWATQRGTTPDALAEQLKKNVPLGRFGDPREIGSVMAFLASPAAAYVSGTNITVDGGRTGTL